MASMNPELEATGEDSKAREPKPEFESSNTFTKCGLEKKCAAPETKVPGKCRKILVWIREKLFLIKKVVEDKWVQLQHSCGPDSERTKIYQIWPGKNVFFFGGRLICGPDPRGLLLTTSSIILSSWIFAAYIGDDLPNHSTLIITFSLILTSVVLGNMILVSTMDPGIIPRNEQACVEEVDTTKKCVKVNGVELKLKYCRICKIFRPPRSCHCAVCDNCVEKFDHHCPWIGQCVGLRNYRFYLMFMASALCFCIYLFAFSCRRMHQKLQDSGIGLLGVLRNCPETLALASFLFASIGFLGGLLSFHIYLIAINQTAYENFRQRYSGTRINPFDKGLLGNIKEVLFPPFQSSRVDFRAEVV
ncbi:putative protein S-acyltransferase 6 [Vitis vinifera]|uniref:S-acyltransferase n=1 Tax=Vitis vinifera TaxID=29760 RepID=A0A438DTP7_VITVI|nr:putative protein S-acyltransferase 6 [Vitis vinifera]